MNNSGLPFLPDSLNHFPSLRIETYDDIKAAAQNTVAEMANTIACFEDAPQCET